MSNTPILDLPVAVGTLSGTEYVALVQGTGSDAVTRRATVAQIGNTATGFVPTSRTITTSTGLSGGGSLASDLTLAFTPSTLGAATTQSAADTFVINQNATSTARQITFANSMKAIDTLSVSPALNLTADKFVVYRAADGLTYSATASQISIAAGNVPAGGTTGQYLAKASSTNYDTVWADSALTLNAYSVAANTTGSAASSTSLTGSAYQVLRMATNGLGLAFGSIDISQSAVVGTSILNVANGGTGRASLTNHGVLVGAGTSGVTQLAAAAAGTLLAGQGATSDPAFSATPTLGVAGTALGTLSLSGNTSGVVTIQPQAAAGTFNFNLPTTAGTSGYVLTSAGGGASPMTWTAPGSLAVSLIVGSTTISSGTTTRILYDNAGTLGEYTLTGSGTVVAMQTSPSLITPALGVATATSLAIGGATLGSNALAVTGGIVGSAQIWSGSVSSALGTLTGSSDGFRSSAANVTQFAGENTTSSSSTAGGFVGGYSNDGAAMASGDRLGGMRVGGSSSASAIRNSALIGAFASQAWVDASAYGSRWEFQTTTNNATTSTTKLILGNGGVLSFGATEANTVPALKPSSTTLQVRLGDDSAFANLSAASLDINGSSSGVISILPQAAAGTFNFNLPTSAGTSGYVLTSAGGGSSPMTWTAPGSLAIALTVGATVINSGTTTRVLYDNGGVLGEYTLVPLTVGGTNANLTASNGGIVYSTASAMAILSGTATANQVLLSGSSTTPAWSTATYPATTTINQLLYSSSANVIAGLATANGGMMNASSSGVPSMTVSPTLGVQQTTRGSLILANTAAGAFPATIQSSNSATSATTLTLPEDNGTSGFVLSTNGSGVLSWVSVGGTGTVTSVSFTGGLISVANPTTTAALTVAGTSGGIPYFSSASTWASSAALAANAIVLGGGAGTAPATTTTGTGVVTALGLSVNGSGAIALTTSPTFVTPVLGAATGTSLTTTGVVTASAVAPGYTTTATAAGTTTLTAASTQFQFFTGSTTQTVALPVTSTLTTGFTFAVANNSTGVVTVQSSGANNVLVMGPQSTAQFTCILTSGTTAASWSVQTTYANVPQNSQSAAYTTVLSDSGKHILHPTADNNARTFTIDSNANVPYPIGTTITFYNQINTVTISITSDTLTLAGAGSTGSRSLAASGIATAMKVGTTSWVISGVGLT